MQWSGDRKSALEDNKYEIIAAGFLLLCDALIDPLEVQVICIMSHRHDMATVAISCRIDMVVARRIDMIWRRSPYRVA